MSADFINLIPSVFFTVVFGLFINRPRALAFLSARVQRSYGLCFSLALDFLFVLLFGFVFFWLVLSALTFLHGTVLCAP